MTSRGTAVVSGRGARRARRGHPWIYREDVTDASGAPGDVVRVIDRAGEFCCWAALSPASRIVLRRIATTDITPDERFWSGVLDRALARRAPSARAADNPGCARLLHADADGVPGLTVDRYGAHLVAQATTAWADRALPGLAEQLVARTGATSLLARNDGGVRELEQLPRTVVQVIGTTPPEIEAEEAGVRRLVDPWHGHKTGFYLDQQENHRRAAEWLGGGRVLDAFSGEGGFTLPLALAGCTVTAVDQSEALLERAERSLAVAAAARGLDPEAVAERVEWLLGNAFDVLAHHERERTRFDAVILDPPPFARHRAEAEGAARGYRDLHRRALKLLAPGGRVLTFACSFAVADADFEQYVREGAEEAGALVRVVERVGPAPDHPEELALPESRYLKGLLVEKHA